MLFVCVRCACAVRVGVCRGSVCFGALRFRKSTHQKKDNPIDMDIYLLVFFFFYDIFDLIVNLINII